MAKYIDADALMKVIESVPFPNNLTIGAVRTAVDLAPTADVVKVVRCRECQHWCVHERLNIPWCREMHIDRGAEDFCSMAKRREDDDRNG